ncbi:MAG TPA: alpha-(1-_3)-arabinofuranosyltransferase family protein, partial [Pedococcus sp.]|nr:alpha-(1->3)-arabinofuranosyltransferase family protein [Pedococcus sp.]
MAVPTDVTTSQSRPESRPPVEEIEAPAGTSFVWRVREAVVCALLTALALSSSAGATVADTKLDLVVDPMRFLGRALHLWDPLGASGQLQNQAYGYLFPMGPFFVAGRLVALPPWVIQRLWWALVLCVAFTGVVALARRLQLGSPATRLVAGVAFALSPHLLTVLGPVSAEAWPMALAAWVLVPLVSPAATHRSARRSAFLSGIAVLLMGGINATLVLAALVPALAWFVTRRTDRALVRLAGWWALAVTLACAWWLVPLVLLGRYSPPFLGYIESASVTTSTTSIVEVLRGTADWIGYLSASGSTAGAMLLTAPVLVILTGAVTAAGLVGVAMPSVRHRGWLLASVAAGLVLVTLGHVGTVDGFGSHALRAALDGVLAPLRNVHKFDVAVRLPLALGLAALLESLSRGRSRAEATVNRTLTIAAATLAVLGAGVPLVTMNIAPANGFDAVPSYWQQAATWLGRADAQGRTLLAPGSRFGVYDWGTTNDEPLQALATTPWDVRNTIPLTDTGHIRWLDSIEQQFAAGRGGPGLTSALQRAGVRYVLVRNDLDYGAVGATRPVLVHEALDQSPDIARVASFGPVIGSRGSVGLAYDQFLKLPYPALEIFQVGGGADSRVSVTPRSEVTTVRGGAESLLPLADTGVLPAGASVLSTTGNVLTDTPRLRETNFAGGAASQSSTLSPDDPLRIDKPQRDYDSGVVPVSSARIEGVRSLQASSSAADADSGPAVDQAAMAYSALDGSSRTAWRPNPLLPTASQWLAMDFGREVDISSIHLTLLPGSDLRAVKLVADGRVATTAVDGRISVDLHAPAQRARSIRLQLGERVAGADRATQVGVSEVSIPGVSVSRTVVLPASTSASALTSVVLTTSGRRDACVFTDNRPLCGPGLASAGEDAAGLDRTLTVPGSASYVAEVTVVPTPGAALDRLIARTVRGSVTAEASSVAVLDPSGSAASAVDGDPGTAWVADPGDPHPWLALQWHGKRTISRMRLLLDPAVAATAPTDVVITSPDGNRVAAVGGDGTVTFDSLRTDRMTVYLHADAQASSFDPLHGTLTHLGLGVSQVDVPGVTGSATPAALAAVRSRTVHLACGEGPDLLLDHHVVRTSVVTTVDALRRLLPIAAEPCGDAAVAWDAGVHRVRLPATAWWSPDRVVLRAVGRATVMSGATGESPTVTPTRWDATHRVVTIGPRIEDTILTVHENANEGWQATMNGRRIPSIVVDGWQQGYVVPAGLSSATVHLDFAPDAAMAWGLG